MAEKRQTAVAYPIPVDAIAELRRRKIEKGVSLVRSIRDAMEFALRPEFRKLWF